MPPPAHVPTHTAEQLTDAVAEHGEGPVWDPVAGVLRFVDMLRGDLLAYTPGSGAVQRDHVSDVVAVWRPRIGGGALVATEHGFEVSAAASTGFRPIATAVSDPAIRLNEGGCDTEGRFFCGSMAYDQALGAGALYRLDPDGSVRTVREGVTVSNGLVFTEDGGRAYYIDTPTQTVLALDYNSRTGEFGSERVLIRIEESQGSPDGMTIDAQGCLWVALWGGAAVHRYTPTGELAEIVRLPASNVSACAFGGASYERLYITTSSQGIDLVDEPCAGALFGLDLAGVSGVPPLAFAG
ncbi:SMP-30/gluconolactonase/LRE family protein [Jatrophihabitans telluris]|uniref:Regucalcin n=1 Tax=Jatrophihabitans telluris TaxID=2038343 RepID=A0ABY4R0S1_9ACTN|nr:SMP-30/gluconolactonase/LRE family protein [Jatrophihabitans telluris]UQX89393.1 SMP-30/gluconolactonase/LRE family protein [Jatrophihabitans telluris]